MMAKKARAMYELHRGEDAAAKAAPDTGGAFDYGRLSGRTVFSGSPPAVMKERTAAKDWEVTPNARAATHDQCSVRALSWIENSALGFRLGEHRNYILLPP